MSPSTALPGACRCVTSGLEHVLGLCGLWGGWVFSLELLVCSLTYSERGASGFLGTPPLVIASSPTQRGGPGARPAAGCVVRESSDSRRRGSVGGQWSCQDLNAMVGTSGAVQLSHACWLRPALQSCSRQDWSRSRFSRFWDKIFKIVPAAMGLREKCRGHRMDLSSPAYSCADCLGSSLFLTYVMFRPWRRFLGPDLKIDFGKIYCTSAVTSSAFLFLRGQLCWRSYLWISWPGTLSRQAPEEPVDYQVPPGRFLISVVA